MSIKSVKYPQIRLTLFFMEDWLCCNYMNAVIMMQRQWVMWRVFSINYKVLNFRLICMVIWYGHLKVVIYVYVYRRCHKTNEMCITIFWKISRERFYKKYEACKKCCTWNECWAHLFQQNMWLEKKRFMREKLRTWKSLTTITI